MGDRPREGMITLFYGNPAEADVGGGFDTVLPGDLWNDLEGGMWRFNGWCWVEVRDAPLSPTQHDHPLR